MSSPLRRRGLFTSEAFDKAQTTIVGLLTATKIERAPRGEGGANNYMEVPDNAIRFQAAKTLIELETGRAPQSLDVNMPADQAKIPTTDDAIALISLYPEFLHRILSENVINTMKRAQKAGRMQDAIEIPKN